MQRITNVLLLNESKADCEMLSDASTVIPKLMQFDCCDDGPKAVARLMRWGHHANETKPDLLLIDLRLPGVTGLEVMALIRVQPDLRDLPITVYCDEITNSERAICVHFKVCAFFKKVNSTGDCEDVIRGITALHLN